jgi:TonB family protein
MRLSGFTVIGLVALGSCQAEPDSTVDLVQDRGAASGSLGDEPPVPLDPEPDVEYPAALFAQKISGTVLLRMFVTEAGRLVAESTRVEESSGWPAMDSAALAAAPRLRYAPALRDGVPVASHFTQPVHFRHPDRGGTTP